MDAAIMQKLLPKLHGSKKKLGPVLETLIELCGVERVGGGDSAVVETYSGRYPKSLEKLERMQSRLKEHGFTSFAEA